MFESVQLKILPILTTIAQYNRQSQSDDRGKFYFGENSPESTQVYGNSFFRLVLECIFVWGFTYQNSEFATSFRHLRETLGIKFPDSFNYFRDFNEKLQRIQKQDQVRVEDGQSPALEQHSSSSSPVKQQQKPHDNPISQLKEQF